MRRRIGRNFTNGWSGRWSNRNTRVRSSWHILPHQSLLLPSQPRAGATASAHRSDSVPVDRFVPKIVAMEPGAVSSGAKLALLVTPVIVWPFAVRVSARVRKAAIINAQCFIRLPRGWRIAILMFLRPVRQGGDLDLPHRTPSKPISMICGKHGSLWHGHDLELPRLSFRLLFVRKADDNGCAT